jgi:phenylacetate-CoA ligase
MFKKLKESFHYAQFCILHRRSLRAISRWQSKYLHFLVKEAYKNVPLWRRIFSEMNIRPDDIRSIEDISRLPVTNKKTYLGLMPEEYFDGARVRGSFWYTTSGISGMPFSFLGDERLYLPKYVGFSVLRFLWWLGEWRRDLSLVKVARIKIRTTPSNYQFIVSVKDFQTDPRRALSDIAEFEPEILASYPSILLDAARMIEKDPTFPRPKPRFIASFGEMLQPSTRSYVEKVFGCEIYDRYALEEVGAIGLECSVHDGFHINCESVIVEVLDASNAPVLPGTTGKIMVTALFGYAMPFIRYETGDRGVLSYEPCACGLHSPRVWVTGRYSAYLTFPLRRVHHLEFDGAMDMFMNRIFQYQIVKKSDKEIIARIVAGPSYDDSVLKEVGKSLGTVVGPEVRVIYELVDKIPFTARGKSHIVVDESGA